MVFFRPGGGQLLRVLAVSSVGALTGALIGTRADLGGGLGVDHQVLQAGLKQTTEDVIMGQVRGGQDFLKQDGDGRLVTGHRGSTSW